MRSHLFQAIAFIFICLPLTPGARPQKPKEEPLYLEKLNCKIPHISTDDSVTYDYDIVYVRAQRAGDKIHKRFYTDIATPVTLEPGADLMLLKPNGKEEVLVKGGEGAVTDPVVSFDGKWVYYTLIHTLKGAGADQPPVQGADIFKMHVPTRKIVRLTHQEFTPNTGAAHWSSDYRKAEKDKTHLSYGVLNFGAYPLPGGRIVFTSNRNAFRPPRGYPRVAMQLFVMDDDGSNVECIGHFNVAGALHPVVLRDGRIMFSSLESQGARSDILWGVWTIHPDGTNWNPLVSAFDPGGAPNAFHFQTQLSDGSIVVEGYYNQNNSGFGTYIKLPEHGAYPLFRSAYRGGQAEGWRFGRHDNGKGVYYRLPFHPIGSQAITPFARIDDGPAGFADLKDKHSPRVGKFTHPSGAPDNHLLTIYSPGPANHQYTYLPQINGGIYLLKNGKPIDEPGKLRLIKTDPKYNAQWPRALVPYKRIYGVAQPKQISPMANDGSRSPSLPEGTPFGIVGTSSLYKRESYPNGDVPSGQVTATYVGKGDPWQGLDAFTSHGNGMPLNWHNQGADAGLYSNDDIHAIRIVAMEPNTDRNRGPKSGRLFESHARERLRILGEIPVRKLQGKKQPIDSDENPYTSFVARIPADMPFTFQTLNKEGMVLNASQTWHQLRPGEVRVNCGGCHAHSQKPTTFEKEPGSGLKGHKIWDLVNRTPLLTAKANDPWKYNQYDEKDTTGLRYAAGVTSVEYHRSIEPILQRSCVACHTGKVDKPAGNLVLDGPEETVEGRKVPGAYFRLAMDERAKYGHKPVGYDSWGYPQASRYVRKFQSRRSLLIWKIYGKRLDGFDNDDHPSETKPGSGQLAFKGKPVDVAKFKHRADVDFVGSIMPPPQTANEKAKGIAPLTDEERRTFTRWIDLGCPLDLDYDKEQPDKRGLGFFCDDTRPTLTMTLPHSGKNPRLERILVGMHDYYSGLDKRSFQVTADFDVDGMEAGTNLARRFRRKSQGVWELRLKNPITLLSKGTLTVSVKDKQGNLSRIVRTISVGPGS
jgi:hypothetical protein